MTHSVEKEFVFKFQELDQKSTLKVPLRIPLEETVNSLVGRLVKAHNLPCYVENDLQNSLEQFVSTDTNQLDDDNAEKAINKVKNGDVNVEVLVDQWAKSYSQDVKAYAQPEELTNDEVFFDVYHTLIHSQALETLLNLEHTYALSTSDITEQRDRDLAHLEKRQREEMEHAVQNVGITYTDDQINMLAQRHLENTQLIESKWASELSNQQETQKREYREWVMKVHEDTQATSGTPNYLNRVRAMTNTLPDAEEEERHVQMPRLEESFTIYLGAQMKTTHNLRLLCADVLDLCRHKAHTVGGVMIPQPQRLQTAMSLFSNNLCGVIMLVDSRLNTYSGIKRDFARVCEQSTDFHFPGIEQQFLLIEQEVLKANEIRNLKKIAGDIDKVSLQSCGSSGSMSDTQQEKGNRLHTGDFYLTRHSNLSEVHVMFHLVSDDSVKSAEITSRHPVILSIRNIIKMCFHYDITTLTIPLLLTNEVSEDMSLSWCMKRAELIFKCIKGFMMEFATYSANESRTIQFLVPFGISDELFSSISNMLPTIFRLSNPVVMKSAPSSR